MGQIALLTSEWGILDAFSEWSQWLHNLILIAGSRKNKSVSPDVSRASVW